MTPAYYSPNLHTPLANKLICFILGLIVVFFLGFVHGVVTLANPFFYLGVVIAAGFGFITGVFYRALSKITKIRDKRFVLYSGIVLAFIGVFFSWSSYIQLWCEGSDFLLSNYIESIGMLLQLDDFVNGFRALYIKLPYEIFETTISGKILLLIWLLELTIVLSSLYRVLKHYNVGPFNERKNKWYTKYTLYREYQSMPNERWFFSLEGDSYFDKLNQLKPGRSTRLGKVSIFYLDTAHQAFLLYENIERNGQGKKEKVMPIIDKLIIPHQDAKQIIDKCHGRKTFYFDY